MMYNCLKVLIYLYMYIYVFLYELWWRICYSLLFDDVIIDSVLKFWCEVFVIEFLVIVYMYSYKILFLLVKLIDIDGSENIRILNFVICICIYIMFFNEWKFFVKVFFFNFLVWYWRGLMVFFLLIILDYRNIVFIWEEFFDLLWEVMFGFKIFKIVMRLIL